MSEDDIPDSFVQNHRPCDFALGAVGWLFDIDALVEIWLQLVERLGIDNLGFLVWYVAVPRGLKEAIPRGAW